MSAAGWFACGRNELDRVRDISGARDVATITCVWIALLDLANRARSDKFSAHVSRIARLSGLSYSTVTRGIRKLETAGLLVVNARRLEGTKGFDASEYQIKSEVAPSVSVNEPSFTMNEPSFNCLRTTDRKKHNKETKKVLTAESFRQQATETNSGRLPATELERFCSYWLETDAKGKCRFQEQKFFAMSRRIATWAARDGRRNAPASGLVRRAD